MSRYVTLIQASSQRLSEMREKMKVLQNEVQILKQESQGKDKTIAETKTKVRSSFDLRLSRQKRGSGFSCGDVGACIYRVGFFGGGGRPGTR